MDVARFLIRMSCETGIEEVLWVKINGSKVRLKLIEDGQAPLRIVSNVKDSYSSGFSKHGFFDKEAEVDDIL